MFTPDSQTPVATRNLNLDLARTLATEPVFQRMLPWAADLERSGHEVAGLPDEFWPGPGR